MPFVGHFHSTGWSLIMGIGSWRGEAAGTCAGLFVYCLPSLIHSHCWARQGFLKALLSRRLLW